MNKMVNNLGAGVALAVSLGAQAQEAVTVSVSAPPLVENGSENALASITVSETVADALTPGGWFSLYFRENPDQSLTFSSASSFTGAASALSPRGFLLSVQVAGSDSSLDSITVHPSAFLDFDSDFQNFAGTQFSVELIDGTLPPFMGPSEGPPAGLGAAAGSYALGQFGEVMELELGFEVDLQVGQTLSQDILTSTGAFLGPYQVESEDPGIATITASGSQALITGVSAGMTYVHVEDSLGRSDHLIVNVLPAPATAPAPTTPPIAGPEAPASGNGGDDATAGGDEEIPPPPEETPAPPSVPETPVTTPEEVPPAAPDESPLPTPTPEAPVTPTVPEVPPASAQDGSTPGAGADIGTGVTPSAPSPAPETSPAPVAEATPTPIVAPAPSPSAPGVDVGAAPSAGAFVPLLTLPRLPASAVVGGGSTAAGIAAGAVLSGTQTIRNGFQTDQRVRVEGQIMPEEGQLNQPADLFVAVRYTAVGGASAWYFKNGAGGFSRWDGRLESLQPADSVAALGGTEPLTVHEGLLLPGSYELYLGYMAEGDSLIYSSTPLAIEVE